MLTPKQYLTYQFIRHYILQHQRSPSVREIAEGTNLKNSHGVAHRNIQALIEAGLIAHEPNKNRSIKIVDHAAANTSLLPIIGQIAAGEPTKPVNQQTVLDVTELLLNDKLGVIQITDDSLEEHNISSGDYILYESTKLSPEHKQAVFIVGDNLVKIGVYQENDDSTITILGPSPNTYPNNEVKMQGIYTGIIRMAKGREKNAE